MAFSDFKTIPEVQKRFGIKTNFTLANLPILFGAVNSVFKATTSVFPASIN